MRFNSVGEITEKILEIEKKYNLLDWTLKGVKIYQVIRYLIYINAIDSNIEKKERKSIIKPALFNKIVNKSSRLKNFLFYNPFNDTKQSDYLLFESGRKQNINGSFIDPFTTVVKNNLLKTNSSFSVYQTGYYFDRLSEKSKNVKHLDYFFLSAGLKSKFFKINFDSEETELINKYGKILTEELNLKSDFFSLVKSKLVFFLIYSEYYSRLLDIKKPKEIFLVNFCDKTALINECKKRKIQVTDIQHGFISSKDIIYHYPDSPENGLEYFPDKFLAWSEFWLGGCKLPISKENISVIENYVLNLQVEKFKHVRKNEKKVLILSQDKLTVQILEKITNIVKNNPEHNFFYKPHPNEYAFFTGIRQYTELTKLRNFFTVGITDDLYSHFADSKIVLGVYTTSLIEALHFNCDVFILDLPGSEMMNHLIEKGMAKQIQNLALI